MLQELNFDNISKVEPVSAPKLKNEDIIIVVMGPTGTGKSTFIQTVTSNYYGSNEVGHELNSATSEVSALRITFGEDSNTNLVLVDTPGFGATHRTDYEILEDIVRWLNAVRTKGFTAQKRTTIRKICGILYLHRITDIRFTDSAATNFELFKMLCGKDFYNRVILTTTMWPAEDSLTDELKNECEMREQELKDDHWKLMVDSGAKIHRFTRTLRSVEEIVNELIKVEHKHRKQADMQIQQELELQPLWKTRAGQYLRQRIKGLLQFGKYPPARLFEKYDFDKIDMIMHVDAGGLNEDDMIIVIMGPPGTGKTTFIRTVMGDKEVFRHQPYPPMNGITAQRITFTDNDGANLVLVDTPGFGHAGKTDLQILEAVAWWLKEAGTNTYGSRGGAAPRRVSGIVYLHPVTDIGVPADIIKKNLDVFQELCGKDFCDRVILTTTMWPDKNDPTYTIEKERQCILHVQELMNGDWRWMVAWGAEVIPFDRTRQSALKIINGIVDAEHKKHDQLHEHIMQIQRELVREFKTLPSTQAGRRLRSILRELAWKQGKEIELRRRILENPPHSDSRLNEDLQRLVKEKEANEYLVHKLQRSLVSQIFEKMLVSRVR